MMLYNYIELTFRLQKTGIRVWTFTNMAINAVGAMKTPRVRMPEISHLLRKDGYINTISIYSDLMGFYSDLMGFYSDSIVY